MHPDTTQATDDIRESAGPDEPVFDPTADGWMVERDFLRLFEFTARRRTRPRP
jgi:hypothetical protein